MYTYKYVKTTLGGKLSNAGYKETINHNAADDWRLIQILPIKYNCDGRPIEFEIIFEKHLANK